MCLNYEPKDVMGPVANLKKNSQCSLSIFFPLQVITSNKAIDWFIDHESLWSIDYEVKKYRY